MVLGLMATHLSDTKSLSDSLADWLYVRFASDIYILVKFQSFNYPDGPILCPLGFRYPYTIGILKFPPLGWLFIQCDNNGAHMVLLCIHMPRTPECVTHVPTCRFADKLPYLVWLIDCGWTISAHFQVELQWTWTSNLIKTYGKCDGWVYGHPVLKSPRDWGHFGWK